MDEKSSTLTIVTTGESKLRSSGDSQATKLIEKSVPIEKLQESYTRFMESLRHVLSAEQKRIGDLVLDEVTFSAEIGADGEFKLLGTGAGISVRSGVTFTLRREQIEKSA